MTTTKSRIVGWSRRTLRPINEQLGRRVFGNTNTFSTNLSGHFQIKKIQIQGGQRNGAYTSIDVDRLRREGFVLLPEPVAAPVMQQVRAQYDSLISDPSPCSHRRSHPHVRYRRIVRDAHLSIPATADIVTDDLANALVTYYGTHFLVIEVRAYRTHHVPAGINNHGVYAHSWHCDTLRSSFLKLLVNISDVTDHDGPTHIQSIARTREMVLRGFGTGDRFSPGGASDVIDEPVHVTKLIGPSGTSLLANSFRCLHRSGIPFAGRHRDLLVMTFAPSPRPLRDDWVTRPLTKEWLLVVGRRTLPPDEAPME